MPVQLIDRYWSCGVYHPYRIMGERNPNCDELTFKMMDLKNPNCQAHSQAVEYFAKRWGDLLTSLLVDNRRLVEQNFNIAIIPKHERGRVSEGLQAVAGIVATRIGYLPNPPPIILYRKYDVPSAHNSSGGRSVMTHIDSIEVLKNNLLKGAPTVLLDDVKTTGVSMSACRQLLEQAGSGVVIPMPILETA